MFERPRRRADPRGELLEEYPQAGVVELGRRLDDLCNGRLIARFDHSGECLCEVVRQLIHLGRV